MGTISGMGFAQALVHTVHSTRAFGTRAMNCMHLCLCKTHSRDCPHAEIRHLYNCELAHYVQSQGYRNGYNPIDRADGTT